MKFELLLGRHVTEVDELIIDDDNRMPFDWLENDKHIFGINIVWLIISARNVQCLWSRIPRAHNINEIYSWKTIIVDVFIVDISKTYNNNVIQLLCRRV